VGVGLALIGLTLLVLAAISRRLSSWWLTPAIVVVVVGVLLGPLVLDKLSSAPTSETVRSLAEAALALVLFSDSSRVDLSALRRQAGLPIRLLGIGLPLTIVAGTALALVLFGSLSLSEALVLGVILAPTDAGLGSAVVTDERLPRLVRQSLNVESGLNDGICVPILLVALAVVASSDGLHLARVVGEQIGYGILAGCAAGVISGLVLRGAGRRQLMAEEWRQLAPVASALIAYGTAEALGGSGFIAAFIAGSTFGYLTREEATMMRFTEEAGAALDGITFLIFGAVLLGPELRHLSWQVVAYALVSLTLVRMGPVAISLIGSRSRAATVAFLGWFGPRGLASIVFAVIVEDAHLPHGATIAAACYVTVGLSVLLHGLSAQPLVVSYGRWYAARGHAAPGAPAGGEAAPPAIRPRRFGTLARN
jgi:NhaP-type Na+/H+ or K+/H+ antiporter